MQSGQSHETLVIHIFRDNFALCNDPLLGEKLGRVKRSKKDCSRKIVVLDTNCLGAWTMNSGSVNVSLGPLDQITKNYC